MRLLLSGATVYRDGRLHALDVSIDGGRIAAVSEKIPATRFDSTIDCSTKLISPGLVDVHVHLREPGFSVKETLSSGTLAAARGGYSAVCAMPNLNPPPDSPEHLRTQLDIIRRDARVRVYPYGTITRGQAGAGELIDFGAMANDVIGFSDDGRGVQSEALMREAMRRVKAVGGLIAAHCEVDDLVRGGCVHDGEYARQTGLPGIPSESEWRQIERDLTLVRETGCRYHVCHVSTKEGVALMRRAKAEGLPVSCETAPHYLLLCDMQLQDCGRFKMNPPIRAAEDRDALIEGLLDGTIDVLATDHAPHTPEEKGRGLTGSAMGVVGLEAAFPALYTGLVMKGILPLEKLLHLMCDAPRRLFGIPGGLHEGDAADIAVFDLNAEYAINPDTFLSKGRATPFEGWRVHAENTMTIVDGSIVWKKQ